MIVAASGAGLLPIACHTIESGNLANAIRFSLQRETVTTARNIALKMQSDSGARAAADSFYKKLPTDNMRCHFLKDQPAVWAYKKSLSMAIYQSKAAAHISGNHVRIDLKRLR
jgi:hypothetical protein